MYHLSSHETILFVIEAPEYYQTARTQNRYYLYQVQTFDRWLRKIVMRLIAKIIRRRTICAYIRQYTSSYTAQRIPVGVHWRISEQKKFSITFFVSLNNTIWISASFFAYLSRRL